MTRPTKEQLQTAMTVADQSRPPHYVAVLAAEVRALQRELELFRDAGHAAELRVVELRAQLADCRTRIARVEVLPDAWRAEAAGASAYDREAVADCIASLEHALADIEDALEGDP